MQRISNRHARQIVLDRCGLASPPSRAPVVTDLIRGLGLLQIDTIKNVARAHDHILWSRSRRYRAPMLDRAYRQQRELFEHFTHDASILPMEMYPYWKIKMRQLAHKLRRSKWYQGMAGESERADILKRIRDEGPLSTRAFESDKAYSGMWSRPRHKIALDYLWLSGELAISHRENFEKFYDVVERVIPEVHRSANVAEDEQRDWLCRRAVRHLGLVFTGDASRFWDAVASAETTRWLADNEQVARPVQVELADGSVCVARACATLPDELGSSRSSQIRLINPFDPLVRDRKRLRRLFGYDYVNEMFVPPAKRVYGYYVYPLLENDRFTGRLELKADNARSHLVVHGFWPEPGVRWSSARYRRLNAELDRFRRFAGLDDVQWQATRSGASA